MVAIREGEDKVAVLQRSLDADEDGKNEEVRLFDQRTGKLLRVDRDRDSDGVIDERFPEAIARYAGAMAAHFKGLVNHYTPHNEPGITCQFCGLFGRWPPYARTIESWAKIGTRVAKGMILEMEAIRQTLPDAVIVSADPFFYGVAERYLPPAPGDDPARRQPAPSAEWAQR